MWQTHPRTKSSDGYPDAVKDKPHFLSDRFAGASFQSLPVDQSQKRLCEVRCMDLLDDMNNWDGPKYLIAEATRNRTPVYQVSRKTETYRNWTSTTSSSTAFRSSPTAGCRCSMPCAPATVFRDFGRSSAACITPIQGTGAKRTFVCRRGLDLAAEFVELVWGDGKTTGRETSSATALRAVLERHRYRLPFDATGQEMDPFRGVGFAGNGASTHPVHLQ